MHMQGATSAGVIEQSNATQSVDELIESTMPLVGHIVREIVSRVPSQVDRDDLVSAGLTALVQAAQSFDASLGVPFARYANRRIRGGVLDELRAMDWASRSVRRRAREFEQVRQSLAASLGRIPTAEEIATAAGVDVDEVRASMTDTARASIASLDGPGESSLAEMIVSNSPDPQSSLEHRERIEALADAVHDLPERLRIVVEGYFLHQRPMAELAAELDVTESRISQMRAEALKLLAVAMHDMVGEDRYVEDASTPKRTKDYLNAVRVRHAARRTTALSFSPHASIA